MVDGTVVFNEEGCGGIQSTAVSRRRSKLTNIRR